MPLQHRNIPPNAKAATPLDVRRFRSRLQCEMKRNETKHIRQDFQPYFSKYLECLAYCSWLQRPTFCAVFSSRITANLLQYHYCVKIFSVDKGVRHMSEIVAVFGVLSSKLFSVAKILVFFLLETATFDFIAYRVRYGFSRWRPWFLHTSRVRSKRLMQKSVFQRLTTARFSAIARLFQKESKMPSRRSSDSLSWPLDMETRTFV